MPECDTGDFVGDVIYPAPGAGIDLVPVAFLVGQVPVLLLDVQQVSGMADNVRVLAGDEVFHLIIVAGQQDGDARIQSALVAY